MTFKRLKHLVKLVWLKRKWVIQSVYNTEEFKKAKFYLDLEKEVTRLYHKAKREGNKITIARAKGRKEVVGWIKNIEEAE